jgi:hypothetical protein
MKPILTPVRVGFFHDRGLPACPDYWPVAHRD